MEVKEEIKTVAFVYKWTHIPSLKWYVGSRTAKGCHPDDGYICSSKIVKPLIQNNPQDWVRTIIDTGSPKEMINLEAELLIMFDAKNDPMSFNMHNSDGKFFFTILVRNHIIRVNLIAPRLEPKLVKQGRVRK